MEREDKPAIQHHDACSVALAIASGVFAQELKKCADTGSYRIFLDRHADIG